MSSQDSPQAQTVLTHLKKGLVQLLFRLLQTTTVPEKK